eukprot:TRINITY_DN992_c0_g1_i1.p1 TRINITY_DN992_c0_g1~~TRINITY_DN992_c0_g1_i1.p1  ORF type:complete len:485 (+),score=104.96 TRINITY_DN992_c0_g1_i1:58-1512(+)
MTAKGTFVILFASVVFVSVFSLPIGEKKHLSSLSDAVSVENIVKHLQKLQEIAYLPESNGSRSILNGFNKSADYVVEMLQKNTNFKVYKQHMNVPIWTEKSPSKLSLVSPISVNFTYDQDFGPLTEGGSGSHIVTGQIQYVTGGCEEGDWRSFVRGKVALVGTGGPCEEFQKALYAQQYGASAYLLHSQSTSTYYAGSRLREREWEYGDPLVTLPSVGITFTVAQILRGSPSSTIQLTFDATYEIHPTFNLLADTLDGDDNSVVIVGAHLDSVPKGPGIVDNGSGSMSLLETALQFASLRINPVNKIRFAWWGAEELGTVGSRYYVRTFAQSQPEELNKIALYMNFDMIGSPNFNRYVYDASTTPPQIQDGSRVIQEVFETNFRNQNRAYELVEMAGGSDYQPFLLANIPVGGLHSGASEIKTARERTRYGGLAGAATDPCYHGPCDTVENIDRNILQDNSKGMAFGVETFAKTENLRKLVGRP